MSDKIRHKIYKALKVKGLLSKSKESKVRI